MVLSKVDRPVIIGQWINGGRKSSPIIKDISVFVASWRKWWGALQPQSRKQNGKLSCEVGEVEGWEELKKGSINGFFNVVISLSWWFSAIKTAAQRKTFLEVVDDVSWVQDQLIGQLQPSRKRGQGDVEDNRKVKRFVSCSLR